MGQTGSLIKEYIGKEFLRGESEPADDTNLIDDEIIDSLGIFTLVGFIEEQFGVKVDPEEITIENFESVAALTRLVDSKR